jgi:hypothetical protein
MNAPATIPAETLAALSRLAASPVAQEAEARREAERTAHRAAVLATMKACESAATAEAVALGAKANARRAEVQSMAAALALAQAELRRLESDASDADAAAQRHRSTAERALQELGNAGLDQARHAALFEQRRAAARVSFRPLRDPYGRELPPQQTEPEHEARARRMGELAAALDELRFADVAPAVIEARCREVLAECEAQQG